MKGKRFQQYLILAVLMILLIRPAEGQVQEYISPEDAFLAGRLTTILEREFGWTCDSFDLEIHDGIAKIKLLEDSPARRNQIDNLPDIEGLRKVEVTTEGIQLSDEKREESQVCDVYSFLGLKENTVPFPVGDIFLPLLADPKQTQFFISYRYYKTPLVNANAAAVGYGETFGFYRRSRRLPREGLQISISGALFAQFNLDTPSYDLINADYIIGFPITYRNKNLSMRFRIYHQSSHLGDEFLLHNNPQRINLSFESFEGLTSWQWSVWRIYAGAEYFFHREPRDLKPLGIHGGVEYQGAKRILNFGHWLAGIDIKSWEENDWSIDTSLVAGMEFGKPQPGQRRLRIMAEGYKGYAPHGQFYKDRISYYGIGFYLGF